MVKTQNAKGYAAIVSGGMDSVTLINFLKKLVAVRAEDKLSLRMAGAAGIESKDSEVPVHALSFDYGQRHKKELEFAKSNCKQLNIQHQVVDLTAITPLISDSALTGTADVPEGHYADESMKQTVVPNRNMIMLSVAIGYAENNGLKQVAIGNHSGDHAIYPDCRTEFITALNEAAKLGTYNEVGIYAPFSDISKSDICAVGNTLGVDYEQTWSCYKGGETHCGKCGTCVERLEAFDEAKSIDGKPLLERLVNEAA